MKILLKLDSSLFTNEQNQELYDSMIEIEWELPFIPNKKDLFDFDSIVDEKKWPKFYNGLSWSVEFINYTKVDNILIPILWLRGE